MLKLEGVVSKYGQIVALHGIDMEVQEGEIVCLLGGNGAGKSTTMKTVLSLVRAHRGTVSFRGERIDNRQTGDIVRQGISLVPEGRGIFGRMSVRENLALGAYTRRHLAKEEIDRDMERVFTLFPRLRERLEQFAGTMSGGEQQMLAIGRALVGRPKLLLLDEPSMGLSPAFVDQVFDIIQEINRQGTTVLVVEQNAMVALSIAHRGYVLQNGNIVVTDSAAELLKADVVRRAYLGE